MSNFAPDIYNPTNTSGVYGDFTGFTFNGVHSSSLGITRTSDGNRFQENLLPTNSDQTQQVPGGDGTYYFGSYYTDLNFTVQFTFDSMNEAQFRQLRQLFGDRKVHSLIFDERPYKIYKVKCQTAPNLKYVCFDDDNGNRVYKGDGTLNFKAFDPYAYSNFKYLASCPQVYQYNKDEWASSSGMLTNKDDYDTYKTVTQEEVITERYFRLYNPGDMETDFKLKICLKAETNQSITLKLLKDNTILNTLQITNLPKHDGYYAVIDTKLHLIEEFDSSACTNRTGSIFNDTIVAGDFFKIPIHMDTNSVLKLQYIVPFDADEDPVLEYNYIYY